MHVHTGTRALLCIYHAPSKVSLRFEFQTGQPNQSTS